MKNLLVVAMCFVFALSVQAQKEVTRFLGIPVDGTKPEMIQKIKAKGFIPSRYDSEMLEGEFNGKNVWVMVVTNNRKVYRVAVIDANTCGETDIRVRFNTLLEQFKNNDKYMPGLDNAAIPDDEDISYECTVHDKRYQAVFYQYAENMKDTMQRFAEQVKTGYTEEELAKLTDEQKAKLLEGFSDKLVEGILNRAVWFMIEKDGTDYRIIMYYDNVYNQANGDDL